MAALRKRGVDALFPIQQAVLKPALSGEDVVGRARTGTGKTLAFALPVIERLLTDGTGTVEKSEVHRAGADARAGEAG